MKGLHPSAPMKAPTALHVEVLAWFAPDLPPDNDRTVIVKIDDMEGTWPAFYSPESRRWFNTHDGCEIDKPILCWSEQPTGTSIKRGSVNGQKPVATLAKSANGYFDLQFTSDGRRLPAGTYDLVLRCTEASTSFP